MAKKVETTLGELKRGCLFEFKLKRGKYIATDFFLRSEEKRMIVDLNDGEVEFCPIECIVEIVKNGR